MSVYPFELDDSYPISADFRHCCAARRKRRHRRAAEYWDIIFIVLPAHPVGNKLPMVTFPLCSDFVAEVGGDKSVGAGAKF
jgi:hypothetical protein